MNGSDSAGFSILHPLSNILDYGKLKGEFKVAIMSVSSTQEPESFAQACGIPEWDSAMAIELEALELNNTWTIVPLPTGHHAIGCKWVYKTKFKADRSIERHKARIVAKILSTGTRWISVISGWITLSKCFHTSSSF